MFDRKYLGAWRTRPPAPLLPIRTQPCLWGAQRPRPVELARDVWARLPTAGHRHAAPPLREFSWLSDVTRGAHEGGATTGWQRGARTYLALDPLAPVGRALKEEGRGLSPKCQPPSPPAPIRTHREGRGGKAGRQEPGRVCRRFGLSKSDFRNKLHQLRRVRHNTAD